MTDAMTIIKECAASEGDFTVFLAAADYFADPDEGGSLELERVLRWMAEYQKYPHRVTELVETKIGRYDVTYFVWYLQHDNTKPSHARLPRDLALFSITYVRYWGWLAAVKALAERLPVPA